MNQIKNILIIIASVLIIVFVIDVMTTKYNTNTMELSCINSNVEDTLLEVTTDELKEKLAKDGFILDTSVIRENTSTEKRSFTIGGKSKYQCNTSIKLTLSASLGNDKNTEIIKKLSQGKMSITRTIDRDYSITENDLGTQYWVRSRKISESDLTSKFDTVEREE